MARITAFRPGQSPPPVSTPIRTRLNLPARRPGPQRSEISPSRNGLDVEHRRAVESLEAAHPDTSPVDLQDPHRMKTDRVGAMVRPGGEHARRLPRGIAAWMDGEHLALRAIEPGDDHDPITGLDTIQRVEDLRLELDPGVRGVLITLPRCLVHLLQRRLNPADGAKLVRRYGRVIQSMSGCA